MGKTSRSGSFVESWLLAVGCSCSCSDDDVASFCFEHSVLNVRWRRFTHRVRRFCAEFPSGSKYHRYYTIETWIYRLWFVDISERICVTRRHWMWVESTVRMSDIHDLSNCDVCLGGVNKRGLEIQSRRCQRLFVIVLVCLQLKKKPHLHVRLSLLLCACLWKKKPLLFLFEFLRPRGVNGVCFDFGFAFASLFSLLFAWVW